MKHLRNIVLNWLVKNLFSGLTADDILKFVPDEKGVCLYWDDERQISLKGNLLLRNKKLDDEKVQQIQEDSERFANSVIWKLLTDDAKYPTVFRR